MRRLLSLLLLAAFGLPFVAPAFALGQEIESSLPACCRRHGAHHCMGNMAAVPGNSQTFSARCPAFPQPIAASLQAPTFALLAVAAKHLTTQSRLVASQSNASRPHIKLLRKHSNRGPPQQLL
jgi:hypothetical protein